MREFVDFWRRRMALHGAIIFVFGLYLGFVFLQSQSEPIPDDAVIDDWRIAHMQALTHALLLFAMAIAFKFFRLNRRVMQFAGWMLIVGSYMAVLASLVSAKYQVDGRCPDPDGWNRVAFVLFAGGAIGVIFAFVPIVMRAFWDIIARLGAPTTWKNWALTVETRPRSFREPWDQAELSKDVGDAVRMRMPIRAFGSRGSWNPGPTTHGMMIDTYRLTRWKFEPNDMVNNTAMPTVWAECGVKIGDLTANLATLANPHTLETATVVPWVRVGGAVSNGCHGTGTGHVEFPELVVRMVLIQEVDGDAVIREYERPDPPTGPGDLVGLANQARWRALLVNLGTFGVIYSVTFECVPLFNVQLIDSHRRMRDVFDDDVELNAILNMQYSEIFWFPFSDNCRIKSWERNDVDPLEGMPPGHWFRQWFQIRFLGPLFYHAAGLLPFLTPIALRIFDLIVPEVDRVVQLPDALHYQRHFSKAVDMGYAIPIDPDEPDPLRAFKRAWFEVVDRLDALASSGQYPQNLVLHVRFVGPGGPMHGKPLIAPSTGNDRTAYVEILTHRGTPDFEAYFEQIETEWLSLGGRPHWGKLTFHPDRIRGQYPEENFESFLAIREQMDPNRFFLNDYFQELLRVGE